jgi:transposase
VWVPDARHEAMRERTRAREAARADLTRKRRQLSSMLLRLGRHYAGIKTWGARHRSWLANLKLEHRERRFALEELLQAERQTGERIGRLEQAIRTAVADWSLASIVPALMAMRGIGLVTAVTILSEIDDLSRFASPRQLMAYLGLVP